MAHTVTKCVSTMCFNLEHDTTESVVDCLGWRSDVWWQASDAGFCGGGRECRLLASALGPVCRWPQLFCPASGIDARRRSRRFVNLDMKPFDCECRTARLLRSATDADLPPTRQKIPLSAPVPNIGPR